MSTSNDTLIGELRRDGITVLRAAFAEEAIDAARHTVLAHTHLMRNTRPTPSSRHLAGFHRFPTLEPLHHLITGNPGLRALFTELLGADHRTIGLSDITINRSQQWHKDLLRGQFAHHLADDHPCEQHHGKLYKVIAYLQDATSLQFVPGSHRHDISLASDEFAIPASDTSVSTIETQAGDAVLIDLCTTHRGAPEEAFQAPHVVEHPRILVSTVFARHGCEFAGRMERGNADRLHHWQRVAP